MNEGRLSSNEGVSGRAPRRGDRAPSGCVSASLRTPNGSAGPAVRIEDAVLDHGHARNDDMANARRGLGRLLLGGAIGDRVQVEHDEVGVMPLAMRPLRRMGGTHPLRIRAGMSDVLASASRTLMARRSRTYRRRKRENAPALRGCEDACSGRGQMSAAAMRP